MSCDNTNPCPCPGTKCASRGKCCECIVKHKNAGNVPYCLRDVVEQKISRALENAKENEQ